MADKRITDVDFIDSLSSDESFFVNQNSSIKQVNKSNIVWGITNGGTGAVTAEEARENLEVADKVHGHEVNEINNLEENLSNINNTLATKQDQWNEVNGNGSINVVLTNHTIYNYRNVTSLSMTVGACQCCGTIIFSSTISNPNVTGYDILLGDDITKGVKSGETWEFSVSYNSNNKSCIIWKNWDD